MPNKPWNAARGGQWLRLFTTQKQDMQTWRRAEIELSSSNVQRIVMAESYSSRTSPAEDVSRQADFFGLVIDLSVSLTRQQQLARSIRAPFLPAEPSQVWEGRFPAPNFVVQWPVAAYASVSG